MFKRRSSPYRPFQPEPQAQRRGRGPRHRRPGLLRVAALFHLLTRVLLVATIMGVPVALFYVHDVRLVAVMPVLFLVSLLVWIHLGMRIGCRVCGMRMFFNKRCSKSRKAPDIPGLGPHNTLALLALFSRQVRCPYCGTPNDLCRRKTPEATTAEEF